MAKSKKGNHKTFKRPKYKKGQKAVASETSASPATQSVTSTEQPAIQPEPVLAIKEGKATLVFKAIDTLFFRESRPMESMGELQSIFPPKIQTLAGAVRTFIGDSQNTDWSHFNESHELTKIIGYGDELGTLRFQGAWLSLNGERLYPTPLLLLQKDDQIDRLILSDTVMRCDLGKKVRLPSLPEDAAQGSKPLENTWITTAGLEAVLRGEKPASANIKKASDLFEPESRVGIARDNVSRSVIKSMLYQTEHIRPNDYVTIELDVSGLPDTLPTSAIVRLGGEGRSASLTLQQKDPEILQLAESNKPTQGLILYLLTPLKQVQNTPEWQPLPGFVKQETETQTLWIGTLNGIELRLHSAVTGKTIRDGGWDLAKHQPRIANSLIPAGSVFFCSASNGDHQAAQQALHNTHIGDMNDYGLGHIVAGLWLETQNIHKEIK